MKKVVIDARELRTSTGRYIERLLHYLQALDHEHSYDVLLKPQDTADWQPTNPNFNVVPCSHKEFTFDEQLGLKRQLDSLQADLVHFGMTQQPIRYKGTTVTTFHDLITLRFINPDKNRWIFRLKQRVYARVIKRAAHKAAVCIVPTEFVKQDLASFAGIPSDRIVVTYEAADPITDAVEPVTELEGKRFIMYVGRPTPHKNLDRLVEAFASLQANQPDLHLVLAGRTDSNYQRLAAAVAKRGLNNVVFTGLVSEGSLRWLYEHCAAYVFPSLSEGFGLPGLEAMVHGAPVVSSNAACLPEVYGEAAHYFDPRDVAAMSRAINEVLTDGALRDSLVKRGRERAAKYSWERLAKQTLAVYKQVLDEA